MYDRPPDGGRLPPPKPGEKWSKKHSRCRHCKGPHWHRDCTKKPDKDARPPAAAGGAGRAAFAQPSQQSLMDDDLTDEALNEILDAFEAETAAASGTAGRSLACSTVTSSSANTNTTSATVTVAAANPPSAAPSPALLHPTPNAQLYVVTVGNSPGIHFDMWNDPHGVRRAVDGLRGSNPRAPTSKKAKSLTSALSMCAQYGVTPIFRGPMRLPPPFDTAPMGSEILGTAPATLTPGLHIGDRARWTRLFTDADGFLHVYDNCAGTLTVTSPDHTVSDASDDGPSGDENDDEPSDADDSGSDDDERYLFTNEDGREHFRDEADNVYTRKPQPQPPAPPRVSTPTPTPTSPPTRNDVTRRTARANDPHVRSAAEAQEPIGTTVAARRRHAASTSALPTPPVTAPAAASSWPLLLLTLILTHLAVLVALAFQWVRTSAPGAPRLQFATTGAAAVQAIRLPSWSRRYSASGDWIPTWLQLDRSEAGVWHFHSILDITEPW